MTIASEITRINTNIANAYTACDNKGATMPVTQNSANLATTINSISGGGGIGITREVSANGVYQVPTSSFTFSLPSNATDVGDYAMYYAFKGCTGLTSVDLSSLTTVSGNYAMQYAFRDCTGLTSVDLSSLTTVSGNYAMQYAFRDCTGLTSVDLSSLTTVSGNYAMQYAFQGCTGLTSVDLSSLTTLTNSSAFYNMFSGCSNLTNISFSNLEIIGDKYSSSNDANYRQFYQCFQNCNKLTSITFPELKEIYCSSMRGATAQSSGATFYNNNKIQKMYFPKLDTISYSQNAVDNSKYIFSNCSSLTELHFGAANQTAIEATAGYSTAWGRGAGNVTIYFDL